MIESTALDLAKWVHALEHGALLGRETMRLMYTPATISGDTAANFPFGGARSGYGFGWFLTTARGVPLVTHGGAVAGFSSIISQFPGQGVVIIVLANGKQGPDRLGQADAISRSTDFDSSAKSPRRSTARIASASSTATSSPGTC